MPLNNSIAMATPKVPGIKGVSRADAKVRCVEVQYKGNPVNEPAAKYRGHGYTTQERLVQRLVALIPSDKDQDQDH